MEKSTSLGWLYLHSRPAKALTKLLLETSVKVEGRKKFEENPGTRWKLLKKNVKLPAGKKLPRSPELEVSPRHLIHTTESQSISTLIICWILA